MLRSEVLYHTNGTAKYWGENEIDRYLIENYLGDIVRPRPNQSGQGYELDGGPCGVYVECGAADGLNQSNTAVLNFGYDWGGILVEPNPHNYETLRAHRSRDNFIANCALVSHDHKEEYIEGFFDAHLDGDKKVVSGEPSEKEYGDVMSGQIKTNHNYDKERFSSDEKLLSVATRTLDAIFEESPFEAADFFSLDVEGYELEVLKGWSPDKYPITYILIEEHSARPYLEQNNYTCIDAIDNNLLFKINNGWRRWNG
jgi:FkbM family methyltransferase|tara:strand:+ start:1146 stop:1913 length:768 start_codon:yes stop_codon:yes gene_type:complete